MATKPPHHVSSQESRIDALCPNVERSEIRRGGSEHIMRNKPNPSTFQANPAGRRSVKVYPDSSGARRETQFTSPATIPLASPCPNIRNEPNFSRGGPVEDRKMRNEPNSPVPLASRRHSHPSNMRNEPNPRPFQANPAGRRSVPACRETQFTAPVVIPSVGLRSGPKSRDPLNRHRRRRFRTNKGG